MLSQSAIAALEIRQEVYEFDKMATRNVSCVTFVIQDSLFPDDLPTTCWLSIIHFDLGSALLSPAAEKAILADLKKCEVLQNSPLTDMRPWIGEIQQDSFPAKGRGCCQVPSRAWIYRSCNTGKRVAGILRR